MKGGCDVNGWWTLGPHQFALVFQAVNPLLPKPPFGAGLFQCPNVGEQVGDLLSA